MFFGLMPMAFRRCCIQSGEGPFFTPRIRRPANTGQACGASMASRLGLRHWDPPLSILELRAYASEREVWAIHSFDGALVGGASLKARDFLAIARACL
jgi:hypothetical protein